jgi:DNA-binding CsgD family transcriptional regulator
MIYIPHIKKRIEELAPRWHKNELSEEELFEFYDLLDDVVREARENRSDKFVVGPLKADPDDPVNYPADPEDHRPETFLIELFHQRIENTVLKFFKDHSPKRYSHAITEAKNRNITLNETSLFREWYSHALQMVIAIILGDATARNDRREQVQKFLNSSGAEGGRNRINTEFLIERHLTVNSKRLYSNTKKAFKEQRDQMEGYNYLPWAEQCALDEGVGYNPDYRDYRNVELEDLRLQLEYGEDLIKRWEEGEFGEDLKTRNELEKYLKEKYIGALPSEIKRKIELLKENMKQRPNLIKYLFGVEGKLSYRLRELSRPLIEREKRKNAIEIDPGKTSCTASGLDKVQKPDSDFNEFRNIFGGSSDYKRTEDSLVEFDDPMEEESDSDVDLDNNEIIEHLGLSEKLRVTLAKIREGKSSKEIATELNITKRAVNKRRAKIREILKLKICHQ